MSRHWRYHLSIDGAWPSGEASSVIEVIGPATEEVIDHVPEATPKDAREWGRLGVEEFCEAKQLSWR